MIKMSLEKCLEKQEAYQVIGHKNCQLCGTLGDLRKLGSEFEIINPLSCEAVRKVKFEDNTVKIDPCDGSGYLEFALDVQVWYEPWLMDRGSYLIYIDAFGIYGKLATEFDEVRVIKN